MRSLAPLLVFATLFTACLPYRLTRVIRDEEEGGVLLRHCEIDTGDRVDEVFRACGPPLATVPYQGGPAQCYVYPNDGARYGPYIAVCDVRERDITGPRELTVEAIHPLRDFPR